MSPEYYPGLFYLIREGANKQVISSQADSLIKISRIWADFFPANTSNQPI
ncbi:ABC transporter [Escherichia coli]|nr:ABC transporter [Escherichia coli]